MTVHDSFDFVFKNIFYEALFVNEPYTYIFYFLYYVFFKYFLYILILCSLNYIFYHLSCRCHSVLKFLFFVISKRLFLYNPNHQNNCALYWIWRAKLGFISETEENTVEKKLFFLMRET